jgi:hypothetical protein
MSPQSVGGHLLPMSTTPRGFKKNWASKFFLAFDTCFECLVKVDRCLPITPNMSLGARFACHGSFWTRAEAVAEFEPPAGAGPRRRESLREHRRHLRDSLWSEARRCRELGQKVSSIALTLSKSRRFVYAALRNSVPPSQRARNGQVRPRRAAVWGRPRRVRAVAGRRGVAPV